MCPEARASGRVDGVLIILGDGLQKFSADVQPGVADYFVFFIACPGYVFDDELKGEFDCCFFHDCCIYRVVDIFFSSYKGKAFF